MRLHWVVGRRGAFRDDGGFAVGTTRGKPMSMPDAFRATAGLAYTAGLLHDLGKFNADFQRKLSQAGHVSDPVRHEWISTHLVDPLAAGLSWTEAWTRALDALSNQITEVSTPLLSGAGNPAEAVRYVVATHHLLPDKKGGSRLTRHRYFSKPDARPAYSAGPSRQVEQACRIALARLDRLEPGVDVVDPGMYFRSIATLARAAVILADHAVSARVFDTPAERSVQAWANTTPVDGSSMRRLNQPLDDHLQDVASEARQLVWRFWRPELPSLDGTTRESIDRLSGAGPFQWQDVATHALLSAQGSPGSPTLVLNLSGTGSGKTRMNLRALSALRRGQPLRATVAMNLRTLTLQTGDAYREGFGIGDEEIAVVIGDRAVAKLHAQASGAKSSEDEDGNAFEGRYDVHGQADWLPDWLEPFAGKRPLMRAVLGAPLVVSTVDWVINAGEPYRQGHHARALLRLSSSDLVLDEIDSYDPQALTANLRLVALAAFFGRHVVLSSATMSLPVAQAAHDAFGFGAAMRAAMMTSEDGFQVAFIGRDAPPEVHRLPGSAELPDLYRRFRQRLFAPLASRCHRPVEIVDVPEGQGEPGFHAAIGTGVEAMHVRHAWDADVDGHRVRLSIGLVRVANVRVAIPLARHLANSYQDDGIAVCCYHSNLLLIQRAYLERTLDALLTRKNGALDPGRIANHPALRERLLAAPGRELRIVVVATPVEEIGRDHDFDWALIEPSSAHSIVQTAGRVNRHRERTVIEPNIGLLRFNARHLRNEEHGKDGACFIYPGLEPLKSEPRSRPPVSLYDSHDIGELVDTTALGTVDARLTDPEVHLLAALDDASAKRQLKKLLKPFYSSDGDKTAWMTKETYTNARLRHGSDDEERWTVVFYEHGKRKYFLDVLGADERPVQLLKTVDERDPHRNAWLDLSDAELADEVEKSELDPDVALSLRLSVWKRKSDDTSTHALHCDRSFGFQTIRA